ncbi:MAG: hypothetical protein JO061_09500, partial [Acidobacteriaceae bacterium]|nr:hypothetical protein [Acidobacteriaceae bacterium]
MSRSRSLTGLAVLILSALGCFADDQALWKEYGLVHSEAGKQGRVSFTAYRFKDLTGALAAWEWQRSPAGKPCDEAPYCTLDANRTIIFDDNYLVIFNSLQVRKADVDAVFARLPEKTETALPVLLTFLPREGLVPDSARYILGWNSLKAFAPQIAETNPGFDRGGEAQIAEYLLQGENAPAKLALFNYPTPDMARFYATEFKTLPGTHVKRSGVLVAIVYGGA